MEFHKKVLKGAEERIITVNSAYDKASIQDLQKQDLKNKKILLRVDYNVPKDKAGNIMDDERIVQTVKTIEYLLTNGVASITIVSHLGRPKGKISEKDSLAVVAKQLSKILNKKVDFLAITEDNYPDYLQNTVQPRVKKITNGTIQLIENIRFDAREEKNSPDLAAELAKGQDIFVNDAFGAAHRAHSSNEAVAKLLPAYAGLLINKELSVIGKAITEPARPSVAIIGGSKVSSKIDVLENLLDKVDTLVIGGGMAYTFLKAQGANIGTSLLEETLIDKATEISRKAQEKNVKIILPVDHVAGKDFDNNTEVSTVTELTDDLMGLDIGPKTIAKIEEALDDATTVIWNGPVGAFEMPNFSAGTYAIVRKMAEITTDHQAITIVGGGDSGSAVKAAAKHDLALALAANQQVDQELFSYPNRIFHISTGGGASLEFMEGKLLPGITALKDRQKGQQSQQGEDQEKKQEENKELKKELQEEDK